VCASVGVCVCICVGGVHLGTWQQAPKNAHFCGKSTEWILDPGTLLSSTEHYEYYIEYLNIETG